MTSASIVVAAHTPTGVPLVVGSHHIAREFTKLGMSVAHIAFPVGLHDLFVPEAVAFGRHRLRSWLHAARTCYVARTPELPLLSVFPWGVNRFLPEALAITINPTLATIPPVGWALRRRGITGVDTLIIDHPRFAGLERLLKPELLLYRPTDAYAFNGHKDCRLLRLFESHVVEHCDGIVAPAQSTIDHIMKFYPQGTGKPVLVVENGVELERFQEPASVPAAFRSIARPRAVYVGSFDARLDAEMLFQVAAARPDVSFVLIGPIAKPDRTRWAGLTNVHLMGPIRYEALVGYLQHADVGLLPLNGHPANATRSPMKLYEYAASGLPVVARDTQELRSRGEPFLFLYDGLDSFIEELDRAVAFKRSQPHIPLQCAQSRSWGDIARRILEFASVLREPRREPAAAVPAEARPPDSRDATINKMCVEAGQFMIDPHS
jgi:glycosyltransferase involved in cell wall biosynthesis